MARKLGIALGSGGARGLCGIGVLKWLKDNKIEISAYSGTSIGSIIGAAAAAGFTPEYLEEIALGFGWKGLLKYTKLSLGGKSIFEREKMIKTMREFLGGKKIEDLKVPFACVASDIDAGGEFVFRSGDLVDAIAASSAIPGIFPPFKVMGRHLVDGELVNPVPLDLARDLGAELVIGVNACRSVFTERLSEGSGHISMIEKVDHWVRDSVEKTPIISGLSHKHSPDREKEQAKKRRRNVIDVITDSLAIVSSRVLNLERLTAGPHFMIRPEVGGYQDFDFDKAKEIIEEGYRTSESLRSEIMQFIGE